MMVVYSDATGGDVTCSSKEALEWFNKGLIAYVAVRESSLPYFKAALQQDDSFVLAHCMLVCVDNPIVYMKHAFTAGICCNLQVIFNLFDLRPPTDPNGKASINTHPHTTPTQCPLTWRW